jgi:hypothetical protein
MAWPVGSLPVRPCCLPSCPSLKVALAGTVGDVLGHSVDMVFKHKAAHCRWQLPLADLHGCLLVCMHVSLLAILPASVPEPGIRQEHDLLDKLSLAAQCGCDSGCSQGGESACGVTCCLQCFHKHVGAAGTAWVLGSAPCGGGVGCEPVQAAVCAVSAEHVSYEAVEVWLCLVCTTGCKQLQLGCGRVYVPGLTPATCVFVSLRS